MSRNDIRLRRQRAVGGGRFRNYGHVLERHEKEMRVKKLIRVFTYFFIILIIVMLLIIVSRTADRLEEESEPATSSMSGPCGREKNQVRAGVLPATEVKLNTVWSRAGSHPQA